MKFSLTSYDKYALDTNSKNYLSGESLNFDKQISHNHNKLLIRYSNFIEAAMC